MADTPVGKPLSWKALSNHGLFRQGLANYLNHQSIQFKWTLFVALLILVMGLVLAWTTFFLARDILNEQIRDKLSLTAFDRQEMVRTYVSSQQEKARLLGGIFQVRQNIAQYRDGIMPRYALQSDLASRLAGYPNQKDLLAVWVTDMQGNVLGATQSSYLGKSFATAAEFQAGRWAPYMGQPYKTNNGFRAIATAPILDPVSGKQNPPVGVVMLLINMDPLITSLHSEIGLGETGEVLVGVPEADHVRLLFPVGEETGTSVFPSHDVPALTRAIEGREGFMHAVDYRGEKVLAAYRPVGYKNWGLVAKVDQSQAYAPIMVLRNSIWLVTAIFFVLGIACSYWLARRLTKPVLELTRTAERIAAGDLNLRMPVDNPVAPADEIDQLAVVLNQMTDALVTLNQELQTEVEYHRQTRQYLEDSEARKSGILDASADAIITIDCQGRVVEWNKSAENILGYHRAEALGQEMATLIIPKAYRDRHRNGLMNYLETGEAPVLGQRLELSALHKNGQEFPVELTITPVFLKEGILFTGTLRNIHERRRTADALAESEIRFRLMAEAAPVMIWMTDAKGALTYCNQTALAFSGQSFESLGGQGWVPLLHPEDLARLSEQQQQQQADYKPDTYEGEIRVRRVDGEYRWLLVTGKPRFHASGEFLGFIGTSLDITERKQIEVDVQQSNEDLERRVEERTAQLQAVNKELEAFSYSVSHDLRAPLRTIDGFSHAVQEMYASKLDARGQDYLNRVRQGSQQMAKLIDDMLGLSRLSRGALNLEENLDLSQMVSEIAENLKEQEPDRSVTLEVEEGITVLGDKRLLRAALENLLGNAWKYTSKHERARISFGQLKTDDTAIYYVKDDGAGFNMAYADKLFKAFQRLHGVAEFPGTGIGLATVARVIHRHGGQVWAEGFEEKGATFYFTLAPVSPVAVTTQEETEDAGKPETEPAYDSVGGR